MYQKVTPHSYIYTAQVKNLPSRQIIITQFFAHKLLLPTYSNAKSAQKWAKIFLWLKGFWSWQVRPDVGSGSNDNIGILFFSLAGWKFRFKSC